MLNRRQFMTHSCGLGAALATASTTALTLGLTRSVAASATDGYKALVCILLAGGNDSYNMLVPYDSDQYDEYSKIRSNLALEYDTLLPISKTSQEGRSYALHPGMDEVRQIYDAGDLAFMANVGTLIEPVDVDMIRAKNARLPIGLFSHYDQIAQWQSVVSYRRSATYGWGGRMADLLEPNPANGLSMNISLGGNNLFQTGAHVSPFSIYREGDGANTIWTFPEFWRNGLNLHEIVRDIHGVHEDNLMRREYSRRLNGALDGYDTFVNAIRQSQEFDTEFSSNYFSTVMKQIARVISVQNSFGQNRQTFFVQFGGWDHHSGLLNNQANMLPIVSKGLSEFRSALQEIGEFENVVTFTVSDFARTLTSNGQGSDHGWGGHQMIMGGAVNGGSMYGDYPELSDSSPLDVGRGVYIPTTSVEQYFAELALWFGISPSDLDEVLPAVRNFYSPASTEPPFGFLM